MKWKLLTFMAVLLVVFLSACNTAEQGAPNNTNEITDVEDVRFDGSNGQQTNDQANNNNRFRFSLNEANEDQHADFEEDMRLNEDWNRDRQTNRETNRQPNRESANQGQGAGGDFQQEVIRLTNEARQEKGLQPLKADTQLTEVAQVKAEDMAENNYFSHRSPTYGSPFEMMQQFDVDYQRAAENIAAGQQSAEEVVQGWLNSPGHRKNIMNRHMTHIGIGYTVDGNYWSQLFIQR